MGDVSVIVYCRVQVERNLKFLGLLVMTSDLKDMTEPVISELQAASIRTIMITGQTDTWYLFIESIGI